MTRVWYLRSCTCTCSTIRTVLIDNFWNIQGGVWTEFNTLPSGQWLLRIRGPLWFRRCTHHSTLHILKFRALIGASSSLISASGAFKSHFVLSCSIPRYLHFDPPSNMKTNISEIVPQDFTIVACYKYPSEVFVGTNIILHLPSFLLEFVWYVHPSPLKLFLSVFLQSDGD